ncbi:MAG: response regulator [Candidatus Hadarchaeaceae archaeon]
MTKKIMVVDDSRSIVRAVKKLLESEEFNVVPAYSGEECLSTLKIEKLDLILLDILMPMNGVDVLRSIKSISPQTKVMMFSVMGQERVIEECKRMGAVDYITKPFDNADLVKKVKKTFNEAV